MEDKIRELTERQATLREGGGQKEIGKQHSSGKLTARERIAYFFDPGTFQEFDLFARQIGTEYGLDKAELPADGVVTGFGKVNGRTVFAYSQDFTVAAGTFGERHGQKICKTVDLARRMGAPLVGMSESGGARVSEPMGALSAYGQLFFRHARTSGVVPQIALILGPVAGGQAYAPALMDFVFMVEKTSTMFLAGPPLIEGITFQKTTSEELGSPAIHGTQSGISDLTAADDKDCLNKVKVLLGYLPSNCSEKPPRGATTDDPQRLSPELLKIMPTEPRRCYDIHDVILQIVDNGEFFEIKKGFAANLAVGFARLHSYPVGVVASNPLIKAGCLDLDASDKGARFVRFCDAFNIPLLNLQDTPGFQIGDGMEGKGMIRHGAKMFYAYAEATVPKITVVLRKAYAGGFLAMCSKDLGADFVFALPTAEICLMGPEAAASILFSKELSAAENPDALRREKAEEFAQIFLDPFYAASLQ
ncbi:MAG: acyl-CoA carboxylase subunit beta, partial [Acidobacteria bacterium]|nr:acyl-CoA carboxylase subunit beta [Acidobacteriota bacterium]